MKGIIWRITFTIPLIVIVWSHAHWSVALVLTMLSVANELNGILLHEVVDYQLAKDGKQ